MAALSDGVTEVQTVTTGADELGLNGHFTLSIGGETTDPIPVDAPAEGAGSVKEALERLGSSGEVRVTRRLSMRALRGYKGYIGHGGCTIKLNEGNGNALAAALEDEGRSVIMLAGEVLRVGEFKSGNTKIELRVHSETDPDVDGAECESTADDAASVLNFRGSDISEDTGGAQLYRWDHGYEWTIEFVGFVGPRPLLDARESDLWAGTAPTLRAQRAHYFIISYL